jgi:uncharacterized protein YecT (DUF1311 family)
MGRAFRIAILAVAFLTPAAPFAQTPNPGSTNWGTEKSELTSSPEYAKSKAICRRVGDPRPPEHDQPTPAQTKALKGCSAETLYYGEGVKPDYVQARLCAFSEDDGADDNVFGGSTILMQVYANGLGVPRNLDLATAYACQIEGAPAEIDGRVLHVQAMNTKPGRLDYCDDITSGLAEGYCQSRASGQASVGRDARLAALAARLPPAAKPLYPPMKTAFDAFVDAHGDGEVDLSGTARAAMEIQEEDSVRDQFVKDLARLVSGGWPAAVDAQAADAKLNDSYRQALAWAGGKNNDSTIKPEDIRKAQRAWLAYRDAFARFAATAAPSIARDAVLARLTKLRTAELDQLRP